MSRFEIHKKLWDEEVDTINEAHPERVKYSTVAGLWYPVKYGIETMEKAVHSLDNFAFNNQDYQYKIVEVHYTTRRPQSSTGSAIDG